VVEVFKDSLKENFILKLVLKLCLLINDLRNNKSLRILAIRWLLNLRFSNYKFNFNKYMPIFSYYLWPFPFDNVTICLEKLKTLYLFYDSISEYESKLIIRSISLMDNYKYFPIFSNYLKSLFKSYFFVILRFPYKIFIKHLCHILRNNLKEVPRILPNMINLLRLIKSLKNLEFPNANYLNIESLYLNDNNPYLNNEDLLENVDILKLSSILRQNQNQNNLNINSNFSTNNNITNSKLNSLNGTIYQFANLPKITNVAVLLGNRTNQNFNNNLNRINQDSSFLNTSNLNNFTNFNNNTFTNIQNDDHVFENLKNSKNYNMKMNFDEIHKYLLVKFSKFIANFNSPIKLDKYFDLFIEIAKEKRIQPQNLITGLRNLHNSIRDLRDWKIEKNILEVCKYLLKHHDLEVMKQIKIEDLLFDIQQKSFDYGIRDKAKLYYKLVTNVEKPILNAFLEKKHCEFKSLKISYDYFDFESDLKNIVILEQSTQERLKAKIRDGGSAIFDQFFKPNIMLISEFFSDENSQIKNNQTYNSQFVYKHPIEKINAKLINDLINNQNVNSIIENIITPSDILRLNVDDEMINDEDDANIDPKKIFRYDQGFKFIENEILNKSVSSKNKRQNNVLLKEKNFILNDKRKSQIFSNSTYLDIKKDEIAKNETIIESKINEENIKISNSDKKSKKYKFIDFAKKSKNEYYKVNDIIDGSSDVNDQGIKNAFGSDEIINNFELLEVSNEKEENIKKIKNNNLLKIEDTHDQFNKINSFINNEGIVEEKCNIVIQKSQTEKIYERTIKENSMFFDEIIFLNDYFTMISQNKFYIKLPLNIYMKDLNSTQIKNNTKIKEDIKTKLSEIKQMFSISLCMAKMDHMSIESPIILPYLEMYDPNQSDEDEEEIIKEESLAKCVNEIKEKVENTNEYHEPNHKKENKLISNFKNQQMILNFPYFYKIYLMIYPTFPIPSDVENRIIFYDHKGVCYTGKLDSVKIKFQDFFLPISVPPKYNLIYDSNEGKIRMRKTIFKKLWKEFKIKNDEFTEYVNTYRVVDLEKKITVKLVKERLEPFLINQNYLESDFILKSPYNIDYIDIFSDSFFSRESGKIPNNMKLKDYYDVYNNKFNSSSYDFMMDELFEKKSFFNKYSILKQSKYHLAEVLIFVPAK